jgi:hypothetical protein
MNKTLHQEIQSLMDQLTNLRPEPETAEGVAIEHLTYLAHRLQRAGTLADIKFDMAGFKDFWLKSVPWCSPLSKQIERIMILYDEIIEQENNG